MTFAAAIKLGAILVPLNTLFGPFELQQIARSADCAVIVSTPALIGAVLPEEAGTTVNVTVFGVSKSVAPRLFDHILALPRPFTPQALEDRLVLAISYTSGTTGMPKGAMLSNRAVETVAISAALNFGWSCEDRMLILAPLAFTGGIISNLAMLIMIGGCGWLERGVDPERALRLLRDERITISGGVPALWQRIAESPAFEKADLSNLRAAFTGGAPVPTWLLDRYREKGVVIRQQYGITECCGGVTCPSRDAALAYPEACGVPYPGLDVSLRSEDGAPVSQGEVGEVWVRGQQLMDGYWRNDTETTAAFSDGWFRTGDLALIAPHGGLVVVDRKKNMVISGGVNIYPAEVERAMLTLDGVVEVLVFGVPSKQWGEELVAAVHAPGADSAVLRDEARRLLGGYKCPKQVRLSTTPLPRTVSNKLARSGLPELWQSLTDDSELQRSK